jgi:hypothetical protein
MSTKGKKRARGDYQSPSKTFPPKSISAAGPGDQTAQFTQFKQLVDFLRSWCNDMERWGQDMRDDLIRLEGQAGFPSGDPGDPPGGPPE